MRKLIVFIFFLLGYPLYSQTIEENKIYQIYNVPNLSSEDLFTKIHFALSLLYQDSEDVIKYQIGAHPDSKYACSNFTVRRGTNHRRYIAFLLNFQKF